MDWFMSCVFLTILGAACVLGVFSKRYDDNLAQRIGMAGVALWCFARIPLIYERGYTEPANLLLHAALAVMACGTVYRHLSRHGERRFRRHNDLSSGETPWLR